MTNCSICGNMVMAQTVTILTLRGAGFEEALADHLLISHARDGARCFIAVDGKRGDVVFCPCGWRGSIDYASAGSTQTLADHLRTFDDPMLHVQRHVAAKRLSEGI